MQVVTVRKDEGVKRDTFYFQLVLVSELVREAAPEITPEM